jgi:Leucine-rich repeat (LRR) protein
MAALYCPTIEAEKIDTVDARTLNNFGIIAADDFSRLINAKQFLLSNCEIKRIDELAFEGLTKVEFINLFGNKLQTLPEKVFKDLVNLKKLDLSKNRIDNLPANLLKYNIELVDLSLGANSISHIPDGFFHSLKKLKSVGFLLNQVEVLHLNTFQENKKIERHSIWPK